MDRYRLGILGLSETRWTGQGEFHTQSGHHLLFSGGSTRMYGVGILLTATAKKSLMEYKPISDRIIMARFHSRFRNITLVQCYAPTETDDDTAKDAFYDQLESVVSQIRKSDIKIIIGDFNAKVGNDNTNLQTIMGHQGLGSICNNNGSRLIDLCATHRLFVGGTKFPHRDIHKYTWQSPDGVTRNQIDHFLISKQFLGSLLDVKAIRGADIFSDHQLLVGIVRLRPSATYQHRCNTRKLNIDRLRDSNTVERFNERLHTKCQNLSATYSWNEIQDACRETAEEVLGYTQHLSKPWMRDQTWRAIERRRHLKSQMMLAETQEEKRRTRIEYNRGEANVRKLARADRRNFYNEIAIEAESAAACGNMRGVYSSIRKLNNSNIRSAPPLKDENGSVLTSDREQLNRWRQHFEVASSEQGAYLPSSSQHRRNPRREISTTPPSDREITNAIGKLKNNKAPGPDNLCGELFKCSTTVLVPVLSPVIREVWLNRSIYDSWKDGVIITIPKKGDLSECRNWRGITLLNTIQKILAFIILDRISPTVEALLREEQAGFRPNRSCVDHINTIRIITEHSVEWNSPLYLLFVDFERAFDMINRDAIWCALQELGIPDTIISIIRELYRDASCKVRFKGKESVPFTIERGVRQGCVLSPLLFIITLDRMMTHVNTEAPNGIQWRPFQKLNDLDYADDIVLMAHTIADLQHKLDRLTIHARNIGLNINTRKTKLMRIGTRNDTPLLLHETPIEEVERFSYLGSMITKDGGTDQDVHIRINKARTAFNQLQKVWSSSCISRQHKIRIYNASVKSVLFYGSETWRVTDALSRKLQVFTNKCLRRICKIFWPVTISNQDLLTLTSQKPVPIEIRLRKWKWIGHTLRKPENNIAKMAFDWNPQGHRGRGRPRQTWRRSVDREYLNTERTWLQIKRIAQDRDRWREFIFSVVQ